MKTMLNISLALMIIAGSAGTIDFLRMFKSGEIDKIYAHEEPVKQQVPIQQTSLVPPTTTLIERVKEQVQEVDIKLENYSRSALVREEYIAEPLTVRRINEPVAEVIEVEAASSIFSTTEVLKTDGELKYKPIATNGAVKKKFKLSMYSRAYIPENEEEIAEGVKPAPLDSVTQTLFDY